MSPGMAPTTPGAPAPGVANTPTDPQRNNVDAQPPTAILPGRAPSVSPAAPTIGSPNNPGQSFTPRQNVRNPGPPPPARRLQRFHGTVRLDPMKLGSSAGRIGDEVIQHLEGLLGADLEITLDVQAVVKDGIPDNVARTVSENARTLKFEIADFEEE